MQLHRFHRPLLTSANAHPCPMQILPALYNALGKAFDASPTELGYLTLSRALVQAFASPLGGIAGEVPYGYCTSFSPLFLQP